jgi:hypothetical protein
MAAYCRYYCTACEQRVLPFDSFEQVTEHPEPGKKGHAILLKTFNAKPERYGAKFRMAWCFSCKEWINAVRRDGAEIALMYLRRKGVVLRIEHKGLRAGIEELLKRREVA